MDTPSVDLESRFMDAANNDFRPRAAAAREVGVSTPGFHPPPLRVGSVIVRRDADRGPVLSARQPTRVPWRRWKLALLGSILIAGFVLQLLGFLDWRVALAIAGGYANHWGFAPALSLATAALFSFGLPGSFMVWVAGILLPPALGAAVFVAGGTAGSLVARRLAALACERPRTPAGGGRLLQLLERRSDFPTLLAVRLAPAFPHSAINVAAGALRVPWKRFFASTALGLAIKGTLYVAAIHAATRAATLDGAISWRTLAPLAALSLLLLLAPPLLRTLGGPRAVATAGETPDRFAAHQDPETPSR